jgi:hypothetical protein
VVRTFETPLPDKVPKRPDDTTAALAGPPTLEPNSENAKREKK